MRKRQKFVLTTVVSMLVLWGLVRVPVEWQMGYIGVAAGLTAVLFAWSLKEGLNGIEWGMLLVPPAVFTVGYMMFSVLLRPDWLGGGWAFIPKWLSVAVGRMAVVLAFGLCQYILLLSSNIFSVAAIRTIALYRSASAMAFVMTVLTGLLVYNTILSFRLSFWQGGLWVAAASLALLLPGLWSVNLETKLSFEVGAYGVWLAVSLGMLAIAIAFWPITTAVGSLFLTTILYVFLGISQHHLSQRLYTKTVWEYVTVGAVVLITMLLTSGLGV